MGHHVTNFNGLMRSDFRTRSPLTLTRYFPGFPFVSDVFPDTLIFGQHCWENNTEKVFVADVVHAQET